MVETNLNSKKTYELLNFFGLFLDVQGLNPLCILSYYIFSYYITNIKNISFEETTLTEIYTYIFKINVSNTNLKCSQSSSYDLLSMSKSFKKTFINLMSPKIKLIAA